MEKDAQWLDILFGYHPATEETGPKHDRIRAAARDFARVVATECPDGAGRTIAVRAVQKAMWAANAAIATGSA